MYTFLRMFAAWYRSLILKTALCTLSCKGLFYFFCQQVTGDLPVFLRLNMTQFEKYCIATPLKIV